MNQITSVCVYCASSTKIDQTYFDAAIKLGHLLANRHIRLINGAGNIGLMRSVADSSFYGRPGMASHGIDRAYRGRKYARA